jgi:hypothetical protein
MTATKNIPNGYRQTLDLTTSGHRRIQSERFIIRVNITNRLTDPASWFLLKCLSFHEYFFTLKISYKCIVFFFDR